MAETNLGMVAEMNGHRVHPPFLNAVDLMSRDFPPPKFAVPDIVPEGLTLVAGSPKTGKSFLALNLSVAVATGGYALGKMPVQQGRVLFLALEDSQRRINDRLTMALKGGDPPSELDFGWELPPLNDGGISQIHNWLSSHPDARMVVVDVFAKVRPATSDRADRYQADYAAVAPLKELADKMNVAVVLLHHTRKAGSDDYLEKVSGTFGLAGAADAVLVLTRNRTSADAILQITGRDIEERKLALSFDTALATWALMNESAEELSLSGSRRAVMEALKLASTPLTPVELSEVTGLTPENARQTARRMADAGQIKALGEGRYSLLRSYLPTARVEHLGGAS